MGNFLYSIDVALFRAVNQGLSSPWMDWFFAFITDWRHFDILIVAWFLYLLSKGGWRGRRAVVGLLLTIVVADLVSSHLLKEWVGRVRPCNALADALTPIGRRATFSFPSSHGATMGAAAVFLCRSYRRWASLWIVIACLVGLSRVYLGLHYPSDVLAGFVLGSVIAFLLYAILERLFPLGSSQRDVASVRPVVTAAQ